jgi:hypothetical protein
MGHEGGEWIPRTNLPIVLTEKHAPAVWTESADFRRAIASGKLERISRTHAENLWQSDAVRQERLAQLAKTDRQTKRPIEASVIAYDGEDAMPRPMVIDEDSSTIRDASSDPRYQAFLDYERQNPAPPPTMEALAPGQVNGGTVTSRVLALLESSKNGNTTPMDALQQLDADVSILSDVDLQYVINNAPFDSLRRYASQVLNSRFKTQE